MTAPKKKLIEVALPLEKINKESAREKSIRHGHPSTLHLWWARRPLAACRAVLFAQLVDDPSAHPEIFTTEEEQEKERKRLFDIIEELVEWENANNDDVLRRAREEILKSTGANPPLVLDPFCGGGSIPLEAQRLGLEAHASDLNPVAVLITKALIEIPPKFAGLPPVHPNGQNRMLSGGYRGAQGLAEDIRYYGKWMRDEAERRIGHLYPKVKLPAEQGGGEATVIAWLWARTVASPNPACEGAHVPLVRSYTLSTKPGKKIWVEPVVDRKSNTYRFEVRRGIGMPPEGTINRRGGRCLLSGVPIPFEYIRAEGKAGRMGCRLMAIVAEGANGRVYLSPESSHERIAACSSPADAPDTTLPEQALGFRVQLYGMNRHRDLFTPRQLVALTTFSDLVMEARERVLIDAKRAGMASGGKRLEEGGDGAEAYADAVGLYLALSVSRLANRSSTICFWDTQGEKIQQVFARQAIPMTWDYCEGNPFSNSTGNFMGQLEYLARVLEALPGKRAGGYCVQSDASSPAGHIGTYVVASDPPYYDNIGYADLSDYFYIWIRRSLVSVFPGLLSTLLVPKEAELIASPYRHRGDAESARLFFEGGLRRAFEAIREYHRAEYPLTLFYAFRQTEHIEDTDGNGSLISVSTGWESMLTALLDTGFMVTGTWPIRTELTGNLKKGVSALASSIVLVCRLRPSTSTPTTRRDFLNAAKRELPTALRRLQQGNIAPVDLAQAAIGPGMAVFSRYSRVIEADGTAMSVRTALALINQVVDEYLTEQEADYDPDTRWAVAWFEQHGMSEGPFGDAETLSKAKNTSIQGLERAGVLIARAGKVRLLKASEMRPDWNPSADDRITVWESVQQLVRAHQDGGDSSAARILSKLGSLADSARDLAYRLYSVCERKGWASEAYLYNALVASWSDIAKSAEPKASRPTQDRLMM